MKIISRTPLNLSEVKSIIEQKEGKQDDSRYEGGSELDRIRARHKEKMDTLRRYVKRFSVLDMKKAEDLTKELKSFNIMNLSDEYIVKIVDTLPKDQTDLRKIISGSSVDLKKEEMTKILECVGKYRGEKKKSKKEEK